MPGNPFDNSFERLWMLALLALWAALLFGGFALGKPDDTRTRRMPTWARVASSLTLVLAAWSAYFFSGCCLSSTYSLWIALGMTLGCLGDLFLAKVIPLPEPVLGGIGAFGLGHVGYITALVAFGNASGLTAAGPRWGALAAWLVVGAAGWFLVVFRGHKPTVLHWAALPYSLLLASTAGFATGLALQTPVFLAFAVGAALFLVSDLILAAQLFNKLHFPLIGDVIWLTYGPAQALIVYSVFFYLLLR
ncbi:MAG TPA: lysoplasmalogenase [Ktedonobacterales bacterium]|jgi:hypothetical protein